ncbi:O-antigen ligase family protein [Halomonas sp. 7T]|uniref:O-antigen ligase family protein n=1 Tax=Halomonas sp. 7T TaxID=2893469 RepID=UPI0021D9D64D|nr:O-antigen ligase family protein [Halomonas sp. 7T]UXZ55075.1 O-antigen ligase family protein [Halomonas sp. 7T]
MLSHLASREERVRCFISGAVFLLGALALVVPSGYSIGAALLVLASAVWGRSVFPLSAQDRWIIVALVTYGVVVGGLSMLDHGSKGFDRPVRFLLAVPVLLLVLRFPPRQAWLWAGLAIGAIGAGSWGMWQKLVEGAERADGHLQVIQFGNLSMLMGVLCLAGLGWAVVQRQRALWVVLLLLGALLGMVGSLMSGSRGGWIGLPVIAFVLYRGYGRQLATSVKLIAVGVMLTIVTTVYLLPQTGVQPRIQAAVNDISLYVSGGERNTSLGLRFEMWRGAAQLISERPLLGWGETGYYEGQVALAEQGAVTQMVTEFDHAHNEFIDVLAKQGLVGLAALLLLYMVPLKVFAPGLLHPDLHVRALAVAGTLLPVAYIDFGLSQTFLAHNSGAMFYAFWLVVLWGSYSASCRKHITKPNADG